MSTGATEEYWQRNALPGIYKHALLRYYIPIFGGKTGSRSDKVVILDGYAGRGRHGDGTPGSPELIMQTAENQANSGISWNCFFFEQEAVSFSDLREVVDEYAARGIDVTAANCRVEDGMSDALTAAAGCPLFLFLDPCGLGLPYADLVTILNGADRRHLPTEVLLNFSMEAVRRIGGLVTSPNPNEKSLNRLDAAVGGDWWRQYFRADDSNPDGVVREFVKRLSEDTKMSVGAFPVRRAPHHQPVYYLVFATRSNHGVWGISDSAAKAAEVWRHEHAEGLNDENVLFDIGPGITIEKLEDRAMPDIVANLAELLGRHDSFKVLDYPFEILRDHFGEIRNLVVRSAVKQLYREERTGCNGVGNLLRLTVTQPGSP